MFRTIIAGTDGSATAAIAVDHACRLAGSCGAGLVIVSAYRAPDHVLLSGLDDADAFLDDGGDPHSAAQAVVTHVVRAAQATGVDAEGIVRPGGAAKILADVATWKQADLIVVGDRGMKGGSRLLGSVPNHLSHHAPCSVMIVPTTRSGDQR